MTEQIRRCVRCEIRLQIHEFSGPSAYVCKVCLQKSVEDAATWKKSYHAHRESAAKARAENAAVPPLVVSALRYSNETLRHVGQRNVQGLLSVFAQIDRMRGK